MLTAQINWVKNRQLVAESGSGHAVVLDSGKDFGGNDTGPRPMELVLMGVAGCSAVDVQYILSDRMRGELENLTVEAEGDRAEEHPKVFTRVRLLYRLRGRNLKEKNVIRAITLSMTTYCSASAMIKRTAEVTASYEIVDSGTGKTVRGTVEFADHPS